MANTPWDILNPVLDIGAINELLDGISGVVYTVL